ncbi:MULTISPECIES: MmcQ/YjbR family DNA-binding protein [Subtercola]|uniref:MmcQ/YjbR family DNA-binding protein n=1 Tax=Subtercola vilae TaxID=2056433 RepID=A0A4T2BU49_9MICO|nr:MULTISPECIES: MmcQ/YjbR family DNA-binding protein [Subtercola]MEA9985637.1 MmcQ/YjbR family DNA-binding protein [Subtercola sp. RTI3]TIH34860.1 MmcQ/YjbR family DNA-binding protein [Subtercola vilae]
MDALRLTLLAEQIATALPASTQGQPFGEGTEVFKVVGKVFAIVGSRDNRPLVTLKCAPPHAEALVAQHPSVTPGYHMNKRHWISVIPGEETTETLLEDLIGNSYDIVVATLPRDRRPGRPV